MHSHLMKTMFTQKVKRVLILVVMEDALARVCSTVRKVHESRVLILVVMEDALALGVLMSFRMFGEVS